MNIYIQAASCISPQKTFGYEGLDEPVTYTGNRLKAVEPDYSGFIDAKLIRRMSRVIKMGVAAANDCMQKAAFAQPGAIITGTAYGCLDDSAVFLKRIIEQEEQTLSPTSFIQSTHNTVAAQIALLLQCTGYNNTFVNGGSSFESALMDACMLLQEAEAESVLVGSTDEITNASFAILERFGLYKKDSSSNLRLFETGGSGTIAGEGAAFFVLGTSTNEKNPVLLEDCTVFYQPEDTAVISKVTDLLSKNALDAKDVDLLILGRNGDAQQDAIYEQLKTELFRDLRAINYKHLCGEYPTAVSFACWLAYSILKTGKVPAATGNISGNEGTPKRILIYNHYQRQEHSLILLSVPA